MSTKYLQKIDSIALWSENWRELAEWYKDLFELEENMTLDLSDDTGANLIVGDGSVLFWIGKHSEVHGKSKDPYRIMIAFVVDDVFRLNERLVEKKVNILRGPSLSPTKDFYYLTFFDLDGNLVNLFSFNLKKEKDEQH